MQYSALFMSTLVALASAQSGTPSATSGSSATQSATPNTTLSSKTTGTPTSSASSQSTTVVSIFEAYENDSGADISVSWYTSLGASIAGINADYTTYAVDCMSDAALSDCSINAPYTMIAGPTTLSYYKALPVDMEAYDATVTVTQDVACSFTHSTESAVCTETEWVSYAGESTSTTTTKSYATNDIFYIPITVTAGLDKLNSPQATETSSSSNAAGAPHRPLATAAPLGAAAILAVVGLF
ncbi:uncharacterized protein N7483_001517 [Penicillium malachiteum]|uniref:uncharacterized protein n=1 Tax=Penicillium malachiteum TaxID=1324776 RepID=UPI0025498849|nr:uncharacterized protein N7483_001517 [Penicillium malachiteum]KAJ5736392.1 hypothetical protein N7483_001517 [Penicillium malachiteum]